MASRLPLVLGSDGLPQQVQAADTLAMGGTTSPSSSSANVSLGSGYILKAGQASISAGTGSITFPLAFPTACISVTATPFVSTATTTTLDSLIITAKTAVSFSVVFSTFGGLSVVNPVTGTILWQAIGY